MRLEGIRPLFLVGIENKKQNETDDVQKEYLNLNLRFVKMKE